MLKKIYIQTITELKIYFRDILQVFFGFFFPIFIVIISASVFSGTSMDGSKYIDYILPGIFSVLIMTTSFFTVGVTIASYKENLIMKKFRTTPMKLSNFFVAIVISRIIVIVIQIALMWIIAVLMFNANFSGNIIAFIYTFLFACLVFLTIGFTIASLTKTFNAAIGVANSFYMGLTFVSAAFYPIDSFPSTMKYVVKALPLIHIVESIREVWTNGSWIPFSSINIIVLIAWLIVGFIVSIIKFRW
ncbi:MAG: ABC transporter permease [Clostridiales bacterium]